MTDTQTTPTSLQDRVRATLAEYIATLEAMDYGMAIADVLHPYHDEWERACALRDDLSRA